jgi:hypothetical protein
MVPAGLPATVHLWVVPGAAHTAALAAQPTAWAARVITLLDAAPNPVTGSAQ